MPQLWGASNPRGGEWDDPHDPYALVYSASPPENVVVMPDGTTMVSSGTGGTVAGGDEMSLSLSSPGDHQNQHSPLQPPSSSSRAQQQQQQYNSNAPSVRLGSRGAAFFAAANERAPVARDFVQVHDIPPPTPRLHQQPPTAYPIASSASSYPTTTSPSGVRHLDGMVVGAGFSGGGGGGGGGEPLASMRRRRSLPERKTALACMYLKLNLPAEMVEDEVYSAQLLATPSMR